MTSLRNDVEAVEVSRRDFDEAMERVGPSIAPEDDAWYQKFSKRLRRERAAANSGSVMEQKSLWIKFGDPDRYDSRS